jgi:ADP-ribose pyrophosphatase
MDVTDVEVVEDRTDRSTCLGGFLKLRRLMLRNVYADGTRSAPYACDVMSRTQVDAVAVVLYERGPSGPRVLLKEGLRPPVYLRKAKAIEHREDRPVLKVLEIAAGVLEAKDAGPGGIERRAADEAHEECGVAVDPASVVDLGGPTFPSPGVTDERVHLRAVPVDVASAGHAHGDGSPMEHGTRAVVLDLADAVAMCRRGEIPDMKTEIALLRLADAIGYVPQLRCFRDDLPPELAARWRACGLPEHRAP